MNTVTTDHVLVSRPKITMMILVCSIIAAASIGAASATTSDSDVRSITVHYDPPSLDTDRGARALYHQIVKATVEVCPQDSSSPHWISTAVRQCREQSVARAVSEINSPRLLAVYATSSKKG
jgi:UrcA family protein